MPATRRFARRLRYVAEPRHRTLLLDRAWPSPAIFWSVTARMLSRQERPYVAVAIRSDTALSARMPGVEAILDELVRTDQRWRFAFVDPMTAISRLDPAAAREPLEAEPSASPDSGDLIGVPLDLSG
jgi:hypothetical protein